jgi:hypothetical protein
LNDLCISNDDDSLRNRRAVHKVKKDNFFLQLIWCELILRFKDTLGTGNLLTNCLTKQYACSQLKYEFEFIYKTPDIFEKCALVNGYENKHYYL